MLLSTKKLLGRIIRTKFDDGEVRCLFRPDPRAEESFPDMWLRESEFEPTEDTESNVTNDPR
jgi:hypothetical protein